MNLAFNCICFLLRFLIPYADQLRGYDSLFIEFLAILAIALVVLAITLLASYLIRLSPFLGHCLFGVKFFPEEILLT